MLGGFTGEGIKTVIPRHAMAKLSCRLVPHQTPTDILEKVRDVWCAAIATQIRCREPRCVHAQRPRRGSTCRATCDLPHGAL